MRAAPRALIFLAAVFAHLALLLALLDTDHPGRKETPAEETRMVVVLLPENSAMTSAESAVSPRRRHRAAPTADHATNPATGSSAIVESLREGSVEPQALPSIDWLRESQTAAERETALLESARRRARGFTSAEQDLSRDGPRVPPPEFGWDTAHIRRIEPLPEGGTLIRINDRCVVALTGFIIPMCTLGKIAVRGDLFEHMDDTPQLGDQK